MDAEFDTRRSRDPKRSGGLVSGRRDARLTAMGRLESIEQAVASLTDEELTAFRDWFAAFDTAAWDRKLAEDSGAGKLDDLADEALRDLQAGKCTDL